MKIVSSQTNIRNAIFDQRSTRPPEVGVLRWHRHTDTQTNGHGDSMTNSAKWSRVGEKVANTVVETLTYFVTLYNVLLHCAAMSAKHFFGILIAQFYTQVN